MSFVLLRRAPSAWSSLGCNFQKRYQAGKPRNSKLDGTSAEELRERLENIQEKLNITSLEQYYKISTASLAKHDSKFRGLNLSDVLSKAFPNHQWLPWRFKRAPDRWFESSHLRTYFFDWVLFQKTQSSDLQGWYSLTHDDVEELGGSRLLRLKYRTSLASALQDVYPNHSWELWRFSKAPDGHMKDLAQQRRLLDEIAAKLRVERLADWYKIRKIQVIKQGGSTLLKMYNHSLARALRTIFPEHRWLPWKFHKVSKAFWHSKPNQKDFFDWMMQELKMESLDGWYSVSADTIHKLGGSGLMTHQYQASQYDALSALYPAHEWHPWKFDRTPKAFWDSMENKKAYFAWLRKELRIENMDAWYNVPVEQVRSLHGAGLLSKHYAGSLPEALKEIYPDHKWDHLRFAKTGAIL